MEFEGKVDPVLVDRGRPPEAGVDLQLLLLQLDTIDIVRRAAGPERHVRAPRGKR
jgi:hypothetical protein